ncbi:piercer of microtubule wall 2 protein [Anguilla rostrata]|uniref:piercer of microtubule wall 2 protein n=1 Tax=Anguilla rostrata TaxID=7938 RepID=UPI0030D0F7CF
MSKEVQPGSNYSDPPVCTNPGNPVFSCMMQSDSASAPSADSKPQNILYKTTSSVYGLLPPTYESSPCSYHPVSMQFSDHLNKCGMYRNNSFNTSVDRSRVYDCPNLRNTL